MWNKTKLTVKTISNLPFTQVALAFYDFLHLSFKNNRK